MVTVNHLMPETREQYIALYGGESDSEEAGRAFDKYQAQMQRIVDLINAHDVKGLKKYCNRLDLPREDLEHYMDLM